jgi:hypothetical protein
MKNEGIEEEEEEEERRGEREIDVSGTTASSFEEKNNIKKCGSLPFENSRSFQSHRHTSTKIRKNAQKCS